MQYCKVVMRGNQKFRMLEALTCARLGLIDTGGNRATPPHHVARGRVSPPLRASWNAGGVVASCNLHDFRVFVRIRLVTWHGSQYCVDDAGHCPTAHITRTRERHVYYHGTHRVPNADIGCSAGQPCCLQDRHRHCLCSQDMAFLPRGWYVCIAILNLSEPTFSVKSSPSIRII